MLGRGSPQDPAVDCSGWLRDNLQRPRRHDGNGKDIYRIPENNVLNFIRNYLQEINLGKVDQMWFLDFVLLRGREVREAKVPRDTDSEDGRTAA